MSSNIISGITIGDSQISIEEVFKSLNSFDLILNVFKFKKYERSEFYQIFVGTTAEKVVFAGDSAGGNLVLSVALRCGVDGVRMPDSILTVYPACIIRPSVSPARLMSV